MKIVNRETFLQIPANTLYHKYSAMGDFGELSVKKCSPEENWNPDFISVGLYDWIEGAENSNNYIAILSDAEDNGTEFKFDLECTARDGLYDEHQLFAVYDKEDIQRLIDKLKSLL